jgi:hypothetical protein
MFDLNLVDMVAKSISQCRKNAAVGILGGKPRTQRADLPFAAQPVNLKG